MNYITICTWSNQEKESFKDFINGVSCCVRCGHTHNFKKSKLPKYLTRLQLNAGLMGIAFPTSLEYSFDVTKSEETTETTGFFTKKTVTKVREVGNAYLNLYFKDELSPEDRTTWKNICIGFFDGLKEI